MLTNTFSAGWCVLVALALITPACTVMDVHAHDQPSGLHSTGLIHGYATVGFAEDAPILNVEVFDGRSPGAIFLLDVWHLFRFELGLAGAAVGVGPVDLGLGVLAYRPVPPGAHSAYHDSIWAPPPVIHAPPPPLPHHVYVPEPYCPPVIVPQVHHPQVHYPQAHHPTVHAPPGKRVSIYVPHH